MIKIPGLDRRFAIGAVISLIVGILAPFLIIAPALDRLSGSSYAETSFSVHDSALILLLFGPFTLAGTFLVIWPAYASQRQARSEALRIAVVLAISALAGTVFLIPFTDSGEFPWQGALFAVAIAIFWLCMNYLLTTRCARGAAHKERSVG